VQIGHGGFAGVEDVAPVDLFLVGEFDFDDGELADSEEGVLAVFGGELFRVFDALEVEFFGQDDGGGDHGPGEGAASSFIGSGGVGVVDHFAKASRVARWLATEAPARQAAAWLTLDPESMKAAKATLAADPDDTIVASGSLGPDDTYTLTFRTHQLGIKALRLEVPAARRREAHPLADLRDGVRYAWSPPRVVSFPDPHAPLTISEREA
jgi:hypothetical protein